MGRLILIGIIVILAIWLLRRALARSSVETKQSGAQDDLVRCAHCGVNLPKSEAYAARGVPPSAGGRYYCSEEHWRAGPREG